ncbi:hypothetical protein BCIN_01g09820 [Botrytis cinerea B05.10]|uniref:Transmembrane protein n=1 Tax=Botryotinia fuckeliana (strain B05.10) TaxID=332648 RepID=A0A384J6W1_BOTFB|nr:hypothetical protein BCIN_01g09820 [Botrytis cinerea B05.10]ATZ46375.1 hypothetical protein BCIN_01g09820 [Botrytis cinerea B05.10]
MPNTEHYVLKRSGWLLLLSFTGISASCLRGGICNDFLLIDLGKKPSPRRISDRELDCVSCRRGLKMLQKRVKTEGLKTPFWTLVFKYKEEKKISAARNLVLGSFLAIGCAGLWKTRGVWGRGGWGWWVVPTGLGLGSWVAFFEDMVWVGDNMEKLMLEDDSDYSDDTDDTDLCELCR